MEEGTIKYIISLSLICVLGCSNQGSDKILRDVSSNSYYIIFIANYNDEKYEIVIPNGRMYDILRSENGNAFNIDAYTSLMVQVIGGKQELSITSSTLTKIKPYILPNDWMSKETSAINYFNNGIQVAPIDQEIIVVKQLSLQGYLIYKDDETGMLVLTKKSNYK